MVSNEINYASSPSLNTLTTYSFCDNLSIDETTVRDKKLLRVVNILGQEVSTSHQFTKEILFYLYNDGTVEKKIGH